MEEERRHAPLLHDPTRCGGFPPDWHRSCRHLQGETNNNPNDRHPHIEFDFFCKAFESVTVLFVELANIDEITAVNAMEAVGCLNSVFSCFDNIIDRHNVYKVGSLLKLCVSELSF